MPPITRRGLALGTLAASGLAIGGRLVTMDQIDTSAAERERIAAELDAVADQWETLPPATLRARLYAIETRLGIVGRGRVGAGDWAALGATTLVMLAQAEDDAGDPEAAAATVHRAQTAAAQAGDGPLQAHAELIAGEIYGRYAPNGDEPIDMLETAGLRGGQTVVGVQARALEAIARANRGEPAGTVLDILRTAEEIQAGLPVTPRWGPGHLHAYAGRAAIRAGALSQGARWLSTARAETAGQPGIGSAATVYTAHGYAAVGQWDGALQTTRDALSVSGPRGVPSWLASNARTLAQEARGRGGDWTPVRSAVSAAV
ncbi:hypothetical protein MXD62_19870 [Frankia sp. Mgl5]|uniref:hypothetical protein n=1 Tax=Frankia sp. Mgl5 TaxID=2933793 RepID=UPI00200CA5C1|nr:hypothetical protein [Frankia sp. Mgl5]MCK9929409.1 hypothetical protein [Frankia sp. Mgl5]